MARCPLFHSSALITIIFVLYYSISDFKTQNKLSALSFIQKLFCVHSLPGLHFFAKSDSCMIIPHPLSLLVLPVPRSPNCITSLPHVRTLKLRDAEKIRFALFPIYRFLLLLPYRSDQVTFAQSQSDEFLDWVDDAVGQSLCQRLAFHSARFTSIDATPFKMPHLSMISVSACARVCAVRVCLCAFCVLSSS